MFNVDFGTKEQVLIDLLLTSEKPITIQKQKGCSFSAKLILNNSQFNIELFSDGEIHISEHVYKDIKLSEWEERALADGYHIETEEKIAEINSELEFHDGIDRLTKMIKLSGWYKG